MSGYAAGAITTVSANSSLMRIAAISILAIYFAAFRCAAIEAACADAAKAAYFMPPTATARAAAAARRRSPFLIGSPKR